MLSFPLSFRDIHEVLRDEMISKEAMLGFIKSSVENRSEMK